MSETNPFDTSNVALNPYAAPSSLGSTALQDEHIAGMPYASQNKRLINMIIDQVVTQIVAGVAGFIFGAAYAVSEGGNITPQQAGNLQLMGSILGIIVVLGYFIALEAMFGITIGKLVTGTRVVRATGGDASFGQIIGRSFARMIPFEPVSFLFGDKTTGWHDSLSGTRVVDTRAARAR